MTKKEKIKILQDIASGKVKIHELKQHFVEPIGMLFEISPGMYEDGKGKKYTDKDLQEYAGAKRITGMIISEAK